VKEKKKEHSTYNRTNES